jgi:hypothetical protein
MPEQWISAGSNRSSGIRTFEKRSSREAIRARRGPGLLTPALSPSYLN